MSCFVVAAQREAVSQHQGVIFNKSPSESWSVLTGALTWLDSQAFLWGHPSDGPERSLKKCSRLVLKSIY